MKYKSIILSNFFWHEIFNISNKKIKKTLALIKSKNVKIFRNKIFGNNNKFSKIGWIGKVKKNIYNNDGLLISFGSSDLVCNNVRKEIELMIFDPERKIKIYLDPKYYEKKYSNCNVVMATYSDKMFNQIDFAIIKPGFGLIKDCLRNKILIFSYICSSYNKEFLNNANALKKNNLGFITKKLIKSYKKIKEKKVINHHKVKKYFFHGEEQIIKYIDSIIEN